MLVTPQSMGVWKLHAIRQPVNKWHGPYTGRLIGHDSKTNLEELSLLRRPQIRSDIAPTLIV